MYIQKYINNDTQRMILIKNKVYFQKQAGSFKKSQFFPTIL